MAIGDPDNCQQPAPDAVPWARQETKAQPRATDRVRRMVNSLPVWEPLPPGEILVRRQRDR